ncbi:SAM-dependent methyltransferase [Leptospira kobayashii]|uniref:SAM-dependent methyltransferase n=1 Tax=Leptospira kobayashii TaxID=1917830 RepID=A0ABN6KFR2_9LEPT|nr:class I SAM-dependent rRNA methyltransferase [Leptospira kobayashii]BDA78765.1 SAM-dependent methyltransferase [Leptospira kobayashii]
MSIRLKKDKEKAALNFHPWVFSGAIESIPKDIFSGQTVRVESFSGSFLGWGHYDPKSQIRIRLFSFTEALTDVSPGFWKDRFEAIFQRKKDLIDPKKTNAFRFLNSEGDGCPGFIVDCYATTAVILFRTPGARLHKQTLFSFLEEKGFDTILEKREKSDHSDEMISEYWKGNAKTSGFLENGFKFIADLEAGQKTGFFLDQKENRFLLGEHSEGKTVLNTFGYSGAFSVYALSNAARQVHTLDISKSAIELCEKNLSLNFDSAVLKKHKSIVADSFEYLKTMDSDLYDLIVLDPPAFTKSAATVPKATRGYKEINLKAISKIKKGGLIFTFSCSQHISPDLFQKIIFGAAKDAKRNVKVLYKMTQSPDHGFSIYHPEGEYLKGLVIQVD